MYVIKSNRKTNSYTVRKINRVTQVVRVGRRGLQGETGPQGPQGPKGDKGEPGDGLVESVNGKQGVVVLNATDVGGDAAGSAAIAQANAENYADAAVSTLDNSLGTAAFNNTGDFATAAQGVKADTAVQPAALTASLSTKQDTLVSGTNIKTINGDSVLGSGDITITGGGGTVDSVNGQTGVVVLNATDVSADPTGSASQALQDAKDYTDSEVSALDSSLATVAKTGSYNDLTGTDNVVQNVGTSADNALARFDGATGKRVQNSGVTLTDQDTLDGVSAVKFDTAGGVTPTAGSLSYNATERVLDMGTGFTGTTIQLGMENVVRVRNSTGATIANGAVVYVNGAQGNRPTVALADADIQAQAMAVIGVATHNIANNSDGLITTEGVVRDLNTNAYNEGDVLYLSGTPGQFTTTPPVSPQTRVGVATVTRAHNTQGEILVRPQVIVQKSDIGLGNVDNTSDLNKPVSTATQTALDGKAPSLGADDNYVTDAEKIKLASLSGTNTGDQDLSGLVPTSRTIAGKALTGDVTLSASDVGAVPSGADAADLTSAAAADGHVLTADGLGGAAWEAVPAGGGGASSATPPAVAGCTAVLFPGATSAKAASGNPATVIVTPGFLPYAVTLASITLNVTTAAAGITGTLFYCTTSGTGSGLTWTPVSLGTFDASTTGDKTLAGPFTLPAGVTWWGVKGVGVRYNCSAALGTTGPICNYTPWVSNIGADNCGLEVSKVDLSAFTAANITQFWYDKRLPWLKGVLA